MYSIIIYLSLGSVSRKKLLAYLFTFILPLKSSELHIFYTKKNNFQLNAFKHWIQLDRRFEHNLRFIYFIFNGKLENVAEK